MKIYTRLNSSVVFVFPTLAFSIDAEFWVEIAWLGFAIGIKK